MSSGVVVLPERIRSNDDLLNEARGIAREQGLYQFGEKSRETLEKFVIYCVESMNQQHPELKLKTTDFEIVHGKKNSGNREYANLSLGEIKMRLEELLIKSKEYFGMNDMMQLYLPSNFFSNPFLFPDKLVKHNRLQVLERYRKFLDIISRKGSVRNNLTDYCTDDEIVEIAREIHQRFSIPTVSSIEEEIMKRTARADFEKTVLEILGFRPCRGCSRDVSLTDTEKKYVEEHKIK